MNLFSSNTITTFSKAMGMTLFKEYKKATASPLTQSLLIPFRGCLFPYIANPKQLPTDKRY